MKLLTLVFLLAIGLGLAYCIRSLRALHQKVNTRIAREIAASTKELKADVWQSYRQSEAMQQLLSLLKFSAPVPPTRSWAASPDLLLTLAQLVRKHNPKLVVELGSGVSTLVVAKAGAKKVIISAPAKEVDFTVVQGVNNKDLKKEHNIISNGSCTTNCLAPVAMVLENSFGIEYGYMTTIHSYTGDQKLLDTLHKDLRRARASGDAMIPTSTGAAKAMSLVLPSLKGKLDGTAIRVPTPNVSLIDLTFVPKKEVTAESINDAMSLAANGPLKGILATNSAPLVSKDFNHNPHSSIFDLTQTQVIKGKFSRILSWYDNEWGFSNRMCDTAIQIAGLI